MKPKSPTEAALRDCALAYPETSEHFPWGERVVKVRGKVFVFMGMPEGAAIGVSVKLPVTGSHALELPFVKPTGYGLGKSGWVSASFPAGEDVPVPLLLQWIDESYRAVAPKTLVKAMDAGDAAPSARPPTKSLTRSKAKNPATASAAAMSRTAPAQNKPSKQLPAKTKTAKKPTPTDSTSRKTTKPTATKTTAKTVTKTGAKTRSKRA